MDFFKPLFNASLTAVQPKTHSDEILQMVHRIDQHLDVMEEKIDNAPMCTESPKINQMEAQMETMKAMMEAMRLEKERQEQEAKKKVEDEIAAAKLRAEQEEARELAGFQKESQMKLHSLIYQNQGLYFGETLDGCRPLFLEMEKSGEMLIELLYGLNSQGTPAEYEFIITDRHIYYVVCAKETSCSSSPLKFRHISKLYSFRVPLNSAHCKLLRNALRNENCPKRVPLKTRICSGMDNQLRPICESELSYHRKKFESVIRLIPGSYQNGDWRQLDGFFGMYYNEKTMEVSEYPPCSQ
jgi:hypothetical protein